MSQINVNEIYDGNGTDSAKLYGVSMRYGGTNFVNRIINGDFRIWQRGTSFSPSPVTYGADRFASFKSGASAGDYARSTDVPSGQGFTYSASFNNADVRHAVELLVAGNAGEFVSGSTWTVSFWAKVSSGTSSSEVGLGFADGTNAGNFGRWGSDQAYSLTTTWQRFTRTFTVSNTPAGSNACVLLYFGAAVGQLITGVQLEAGSVATPFERRPYGTELALCQRYFQTTHASSLNGNIGLFAVTTSIAVGAISWKVSMRSAPTTTVRADGASANGTVRRASNGVSVGTTGTLNNNVGTEGAGFLFTGSVLTVGEMFDFQYTASAEL
jgi:hypothetical protein